jgi:hypothetical protein
MKLSPCCLNIGKDFGSRTRQNFEKCANAKWKKMHEMMHDFMCKFYKFLSQKLGCYTCIHSSHTSYTTTHFKQRVSETNMYRLYNKKPFFLHKNYHPK